MKKLILLLQIKTNIFCDVYSLFKFRDHSILQRLRNQNLQHNFEAYYHNFIFSVTYQTFICKEWKGKSLQKKLKLQEVRHLKTIRSEFSIKTKTKYQMKTLKFFNYFLHSTTSCKSLKVIKTSEWKQKNTGRLTNHLITNKQVKNKCEVLEKQKLVKVKHDLVRMLFIKIHLIKFVSFKLICFILKLLKNKLVQK